MTGYDGYDWFAGLFSHARIEIGGLFQKTRHNPSDPSCLPESARKPTPMYTFPRMVWFR